MKADILGRGRAFPFRFDPATGAIATSAGEDNIRSAMTLILATRPGERQHLPDFGCRVHELVFGPNTQANASLVAWHVRAALERWEPRVDVLEVTAMRPDPSGRMAVAVRYRIKVSRNESVLQLDLATGS